MTINKKRDRVRGTSLDLHCSVCAEADDGIWADPFRLQFPWHQLEPGLEKEHLLSHMEFLDPEILVMP